MSNEEKLDADGLRRAQASIAFIRENFPEIAGRVPAGVKPFSRGFGAGDGVSSHPGAVDRDWLAYWGGKSFLRATDVPDGFFAAGIKSAGGSEYVFAMWRVGERRFWFQDQFANFQGAEDVSCERTAKRVETALEDWARGVARIAVSGDQSVAS